jgi:succinate dehydrogenase/fumarate reductase flavoprotein subunit
MRGSVRPQDRTGGEIGDCGGLVVDWNLQTNLEGLYAAGEALFASNYHYHAAATGRYGGRKAARYAEKSSIAPLNQKQVQTEKERVYAPLDGSGDIEWKELNAAICRVMQNYCGEFKNEELLNIGLTWLKDMEENELSRVHVDNPHKLMRTLEVFNILTCSEMIVHASLARKASTRFLGFQRLDYTEVDPSDWHQWVTIQSEDNTVRSERLPIDFWGPLAENYEKHSS